MEESDDILSSLSFTIIALHNTYKERSIMKRASGVLMPIFCLPSLYGIGCMSKEAYLFVDQLKEAGQSYWQILPLSTTGFGDSPYQSFSSYAGNPYFIDLEELISEGLLTKKECEDTDFGSNPEKVDYGKISFSRNSILRKAYERSNVSNNAEYKMFCQKNSYWLQDYSVFMTLKDNYGGKPWYEWDRNILINFENGYKKLKCECIRDIDFYYFLQFEFYRQWYKLKEYANKNGIQIIGDIPIYVAYDSVDVLANPELFQLSDDNVTPCAVAGCPPDSFSSDGQLWGNPLYRWDQHKKTQYVWWCDRMAHCFDLYDVVRIDHFRGFDEYYSIPYGALSAAEGHWEKGPGIEFFRTIHEKVGERKIIAEDLGYMSPSVRKLLRDTGYPGMKVLEFAFDPRENSNYLPHTYDKNCVVYTGTHDNETLVQWYKTIDNDSRKFAEEYMGNAYTPYEKRAFDFIRLAMTSCADLCVIPIWDYLEMGEEARINKPSTLGGNWQWRMSNRMMTDELISKMYKLTKISERLN